MFSVILPVYNGGAFIDDAIASVIRQKEKDWELIVIDDGSKDDTGEKLAAYENTPGIRVIRQENAGVSAARNRGIEEAKERYLAFLDADDVWCEDHLAVMKELIGKYPDAGLYGTFTKAELVNGKTIDSCAFFDGKPDDVLLDDFFYEYYKDPSVKMFTVISLCAPTEAVKKMGGFPVGCKIGEDLELGLRLAAYYSVALSKKVTAIYRRDNSSATKDVSFDPDWGFFESVEDIYADPSVPEKKKDNLRKVMQWFSMRRYRHYLIGGERKKALSVYNELDQSCIRPKDRLVNAVLKVLPTAVIKKIFAVRWRGRA